MNRLFIITCIFFIVGCKKEAVIKPVPAIVINTPTDNQHFVMGDTIRITGTITHTIELTEVAVHMTDLATKIEFFHNHFSGGNSLTYNFSSKYPVPDNTRASYQVEVEAADKDGNTAVKEITILIN